MRMRGIGSVIAIIAIGLCAARSASAADIEIGVPLPMSGSEAPYGIDMLNAMRLAADQINADGGVHGAKVRLVPTDDACDPAKAVQAATQLVARKVAAIAGGYCSGATLSTLKLYGDAGMPFVITAANATTLIGANPGNAFMINSTGFDQAKTAVDLFKAKAVKTLAIIHEGDAYSANLADLTRKAWQAAGYQVVSYEQVDKGRPDFAAVVTKILQLKPDAVFWTAYFADGGPLIRQLRQSGYSGMITLGDGNNAPKLFELAGAAADGVYCLSGPLVEFMPQAKPFIAAYEQAFKQPPGAYAALSYDGIRLLAQAIGQAGGTDKAKVIAALKATRSYQGVVETISFRANNTPAHSNFIVLRGQAGKWTLYTGPGAPPME